MVKPASIWRQRVWKERFWVLHLNYKLGYLIWQQWVNLQQVCSFFSFILSIACIINPGSKRELPLQTKANRIQLWNEHSCKYVILSTGSEDGGGDEGESDNCGDKWKKFLFCLDVGNFLLSTFMAGLSNSVFSPFYTKDATDKGLDVWQSGVVSE